MKSSGSCVIDKSSLVIDASVALKWVINEAQSDEALNLLDQLDSIVCPEIFFIEIDAVLTKRVRMRELTGAEAKKKKGYIRRLPCQLISTNKIEDEAFELSTIFNLSYYDALYLVTSIQYERVLYTADIRFFNAVQNTLYKDNIQILG
ncbi:type II toxin-antitoxin system VapC family toxin [Gracilimonas sp. BCB1]|uniref:type II toxin-antitoxin system VapC family toxin n=1 Tax=Gracilimonas sp. BCB1 TaxID=3152362 RepID=UPI0032D94DC2